MHPFLFADSLIYRQCRNFIDCGVIIECWGHTPRLAFLNCHWRLRRAWQSGIAKKFGDPWLVCDPLLSSGVSITYEQTTPLRIQGAFSSVLTKVSNFTCILNRQREVFYCRRDVRLLSTICEEISGWTTVLLYSANHRRQPGKPPATALSPWKASFTCTQTRCQTAVNIWVLCL